MLYGAHYTSPFSGFHVYQREDSVWANVLIPGLEDYQSDALKNGPQVLCLPISGSMPKTTRSRKSIRRAMNCS